MPESEPRLIRGYLEVLAAQLPGPRRRLGGKADFSHSSTSRAEAFGTDAAFHIIGAGKAVAHDANTAAGWRAKRWEGRF
jgi:hypothetical protein